MKMKEIIQLLDAKVIFMQNGAEETEVKAACGSDMMSDVLAYVKEQVLLLTGLCNPQVIRTAEMMDINTVCFVRGKAPDDTIIKLAGEKNISLFSTECPMYVACGILYQAGLK